MDEERIVGNQSIVGKEEFPPPHLWALDPLYRCGIKLFICEIAKLPEVKEFPGVYDLYGHPVTRFEVAACIVSVDRKENFIKFHIDDGTGVIGCCVWLNSSKDFVHALNFKHGDLISVLGKLNVFRGEREISVYRITLEADAHFEAYHWIQVMKCRDVYKKPVVYPAHLVSSSTPLAATNQP